MKPSRLLGATFALLVPAIALAFTPKTFNPGDRIEAASINKNFSDIASELAQLRTDLTSATSALATANSGLNTVKTDLAATKTELAAVKSDLAKLRGGLTGTRAVRITKDTPLDANNRVSVTYRANAAGFVSTIVGGGGWATMTTSLFLGSTMVARVTDGSSLLLPVAAGATFVVAADYENGNEETYVDVYWSPLESGGAAPTRQ